MRAWERGYYTSRKPGRGLVVSHPDSSPKKQKEGTSGVLSDISCHMGWGLQHKECHNCILHPGLEFSNDLKGCTVQFTKAG